jgi:hypothetical protein
MANTNSVIDMVAKEALRIAHEKATFIGTCDRSYDDSYAKSGAKIGNTLRVRNPNQYVRRQGSRIMDVQDQASTTQSITVATQDGVDMRFNSAELSLEIDELSRRYIEPAMAVLVAGIDGDLLAQATKATYNVAGTAGTVVGAVTSGFSDTSALGKARAALNQGLAPKDDNRAVQFDSITMASVANGIKGLFSPQKEVTNAWREGFVARTAMADFYENERTWSMTNGSDVTGTTDASAAAVTDGGTNITYDATASVSVNVGQVFTVAGVYQCHPETKAAFPNLQQFVITALPGSRQMTVSPATILTGAKKNVSKSDGTNLATTDFNNQTLTFVGSASTTYRQNLMYHKEAFAFVTADLPIMDDAIKCVRMQKDGISLRVWQAADIRNDELLMRIDILYGFKALRPEWACRITN